MLPHPDEKALSFVVGLDAEELDRSFAVLALSFGAKPKPSGDGRGVVDRLFKAGF